MRFYFVSDFQDVFKLAFDIQLVIVRQFLAILPDSLLVSLVKLLNEIIWTLVQIIQILFLRIRLRLELVEVISELAEQW